MGNETKQPSSFARMRKFWPLALMLISAATTVAAFLQALDYPFISDDEAYITENTKLAGLHLTDLWRLFVEPYNSFSEFLPLRDLSYWFDITLFGLTPSPFRLHNILLYLLCLPLVYGTTLCIWRYLRQSDAASARWAAAAVTALFVIHPSHAEAVVWIAGRKDVLCGMFSLLALWLAVSARREYGISPVYATATLGALLAAMLSKAVAVAVAPVIALLWVFFWRDVPLLSRRYSQLLWPLACLLLAMCITVIFAAIITTRIPFYFGIETVTRALAILGWLTRLAVSPENRHFFYPVLEDPWLPAMITLGAATLATTAGGVVVLLRQRSLVGFALVTFTLICLPSLQLVPYTPPSLISDRFLFLAVWPAALLLVALAWRLKPLPRAALLIIIALPWIFQTIERPRDWRNEDTLIGTYLRAYPGHYMPAFQEIMVIQLPRLMYREADELASKVTDSEARDIITGLIQADYAVRVKAVSVGNPQEAMARLWNLGIKLKQPPVQARWNSPMHVVWIESQRKLATLWESLAMSFPGDASVRYNAGLWMVDARRYEEAVVYLRAAVKTGRLPESVRGTAFKNLGFALLKSGYIAEAEIPLRTALEQPQPDMQAYCVLSEVYEKTKRLEEAARAKTDCRNRTPSEEALQ